MAVNIHNLIAAINPEVYCSPELRRDVKTIVKEEGHLAAAEKAETIESEYMDLDQELTFPNPFKLNGIKNPIEKHKFEYDNFTGQGIEQIYFWLIDYINENFKKSDKLIDNFVSSTGSSHFGDMSIRISQLQQSAQRSFELANTVLRSVLTMVYDLKDFKLRLADYERFHSKNPDQKKAAILSLKERWLDLVDVRRGQASIRSLTSQLDFVTLQNAFFAANTIEEVKKIDLNEVVKGVLIQRLNEFFKWIPESEKQLKTRYELEKKYLKTQVNSLKLYSRWAKPYLKAAADLEQHASSTSELVTAFETSLLELTLIGTSPYNVEGDISSENLPKAFRKYTSKNYQYIVVAELKFRASPQKTQYAGGYTFRGNVKLELTSYALSDKEYETLKSEIENDDMGDLIGIIGGATEESLEVMRDDISEFLEEEKPEIVKKKESEDTNPFSALFSFFKKKKKETSEKEKILPKDSSEEKVLRNQAIIMGRLECRKFYTSYKGSYDLPGFF
jgi:hypothetical protein